jgi:hypothetical protein
VLREAGVPVVNQREVSRMMGMLDIDASRGISYEEFRNFACLLPRSQVRVYWVPHAIYAR